MAPSYEEPELNHLIHIFFFFFFFFFFLFFFLLSLVRAPAYHPLVPSKMASTDIEEEEVSPASWSSNRPYSTHSNRFRNSHREQQWRPSIEIAIRKGRRKGRGRRGRKRLEEMEPEPRGQRTSALACIWLWWHRTRDRSARRWWSRWYLCRGLGSRLSLAAPTAVGPWESAATSDGKKGGKEEKNREGAMTRQDKVHTHLVVVDCVTLFRFRQFAFDKKDLMGWTGIASGWEWRTKEINLKITKLISAWVPPRVKLCAASRTRWTPPYLRA